MAKGGFFERDPSGTRSYLAEELANGVTREALLESMERLLFFTQRAGYQWNGACEALIYATVARSGRTFDGICKLLRAGLAVQAAMLTRSLFEDMIVGHWLLYNYKEPDWLVEKFLRHREAIALHQQKLQKETGFAMGPPLAVAEDAKERAQALIDEFGKEAQRNWWDPGREGQGKGHDVGIRKLVQWLEDAAANHEMFHPRFAGGEHPLLRRMDQVTHKWLNQCVHLTTIGLPFTPVENANVEKSPDPMLIVSWNAAWIYTQQIYLLHDLNNMDGQRLEVTWWLCMIKFSEAMDQPEMVERLAEQLDGIMGEDFLPPTLAERFKDRFRKLRRKLCA